MRSRCPHNASSSTGTGRSPRSTASTSCCSSSETRRSTRQHEARLGRELTLHEVIAGEFRVHPSAARRGRRVGCVENARLRAGFADFAREHRPLVVSSGFHELIEPVLEREGLELEVRANRLDPRLDGWRALFREQAPCPVCGEPCKRSDVAGLDDFVYVGDGYSDRCVARGRDARLRARRARRVPDAAGVPFEAFDDFYDVARALDGA